MRKSEIKFLIELDEKNVPEKILWEATDGPSDRLQETNAISLSVWDHVQLNTMRIDLWNKEMPVLEMKRFFIESMEGVAQSIENATQDHKMAEIIRKACQDMVKHVSEVHRNDP